MHMKALKRGLPPMHPGELLADVLPATGKTITEVADLIGISRQMLSMIVNGHARVTPDVAALLGKVLGNGPGLWLRLQASHPQKGPDARPGLGFCNRLQCWSEDGGYRFSPAPHDFFRRAAPTLKSEQLIGADFQRRRLVRFAPNIHRESGHRGWAARCHNRTSTRVPLTCRMRARSARRASPRACPWHRRRRRPRVVHCLSGFPPSGWRNRRGSPRPAACAADRPVV